MSPNDGRGRASAHRLELRQIGERLGRHGLKVVCFDWVQGYRHFFTNKPLRNPADLSGLRIRTPPAPIWRESIRALGAAPTAT